MTEYDILNRDTVLLCNKYWQAAFTKTPAQAIAMMVADVATGLDVQEDGTMIPVQWEDWINLPVREHDNAIHTPRMSIRIPTVIISCSYDEVHLKAPQFSAGGVKRRDQYTCQYCGNKFESDGLNLDHVVPDSRGGRKTWENIVASCYACNGKKGSRTPQEASMRLLKKPKAPGGLPPARRIRNHHRIPDWEKFLIQ
jgi:5-methylcytosine-specific restriction endonuclease McrA